MNDFAISIQGLTKSYGSFRALRGVDLDVKNGEIFGFLGPNGAGKTTTIRCLLDMIRPSGGTLRVLGLDPQRDSVAVRKRVGYLPGELHLDDNLSARQVLDYFNAVRGRTADWRYVRTLADRLTLDLVRPIKQFSKGNKQKVGVVQALMHKPELLMLDEPTSGLDPLLQQEVIQMVREASQNGATVFFSSHILSEVESASNRIGIVRAGKMVEVADAKTITARSFRYVNVSLRDHADLHELETVPGVKKVVQRDGGSLRLQFEGSMDALLKALAKLTVLNLEIEKPSLEEVFLSYYENSEPPVNQATKKEAPH